MLMFTFATSWFELALFFLNQLDDMNKSANCLGVPPFPLTDFSHNINTNKHISLFIG